MSSYLTVFSDSHGNLDGVKRLRGDFEISSKIVFLGDGVSDASEVLSNYQDKAVIVRGNCDFIQFYPKQALFTVEGVTVLAVHGDEFGVKLSLSRLYEYANKVNASLVLYGHTHQPKTTEINGVTLVNPGTLSSYGTAKTFAFIKINGKDISVKHIPLDKRF
ncbi:MAG: YfcE family phosphodiesterase [Clostridia bacterium]|nr:YfcE family phosphodiesterase [Clostridia bacterium]